MHVYRYGNAEADIVLIQLVGDHDISEIEDETVEIRKLTLYGLSAAGSESG